MLIGRRAVFASAPALQAILFKYFDIHLNYTTVRASCQALGWRGGSLPATTQSE
jgi:hypothetical protein